MKVRLIFVSISRIRWYVNLDAKKITMPLDTNIHCKKAIEKYSSHHRDLRMQCGGIWLAVWHKTDDGLGHLVLVYHSDGLTKHRSRRAVLSYGKSIFKVPWLFQNGQDWSGSSFWLTRQTETSFLQLMPITPFLDAESIATVREWVRETSCLYNIMKAMWTHFLASIKITDWIIPSSLSEYVTVSAY